MIRRSRHGRLNRVRDLRFRANPAFTLVDYESLPADQRAACRHLRDDPEFFGLLVAREGDPPTVKALQSGDALLFLALTAPKPIPSYFLRAHDDFERYLGRLLLDRVIEVEIDGKFRSGPAIAENAGELDEGSIADRALLYAAELAVEQPLTLAGRLYFFNRLPTSVADCTALPGTEAVRAYLGVSGGVSTESDVQLRESHSSDSRSAFMSWTNARSECRVAAPFKLYVCPYPADLPAIFRTCATTAGRHGAFAVKVAADAPTLNRPDKFVAYFNTRGELDACAEAMGPVLSGLRVHELPFSGQLQVSALRWGVDPPITASGATSSRSESWRVWVTRKLASALVLAVQSGYTAQAAAAFAKHRVSLEGIDVRSWAPDGVVF